MILIIACFNYRRVFDVAVGMDEAQQNQKRQFLLIRIAKIDDFNECQGGALRANIAY